MKNSEKEDNYILNILDEAIEDDEPEDVEVKVGNIDDFEDDDVPYDATPKNTVDPSGNNGADYHPERFDVPEDISKANIDYNYKIGCAICRMCYDDPKIHEIYRLTGSKKEVDKYINENYGYEQKVPSYRSICNHIDKHFLPVENVENAGLIQVRARVDNKIGDLTKATKSTEIVKLRAMAWVNLENLLAIKKTSQKYMDAVKLFNPTAKTIKDLIELELKVIGMDGGTTPEEQEDKLKGWLKKLIENMKDEDPSMAQKMIGYLNRVDISL